mmetsp:Transcript_9376/g.17875  ORF Transcript_9376/g.17875 Transcript_9376/m.17875 type:complete len:95 (-) Transcript_9376:137-421(-)
MLPATESASLSDGMDNDNVRMVHATSFCQDCTNGNGILFFLLCHDTKGQFKAWTGTLAVLATRATESWRGVPSFIFFLCVIRLTLPRKKSLETG